MFLQLETKLSLLVEMKRRRDELMITYVISQILGEPL